ncbi:MAG TPA: Gx transporter family protein [Bacillota bacterium]|nr:Gx transporter family protein [Bacillota bacterium]
MTTKKMVLLSALTALSIVLNWMENVFFPWTVLPVPGVKLGLANIVFLMVFLLAGFRFALLVSLLRVLVIGLFSGTFATVVFPLSLGGAVLSLVLIKLSRTLWGERLSLIGLSIVGAVGHNLGQFTVLALIPGLFPQISLVYMVLPALILLALPAGMVTGWISRQILPTLKQEWEGL